MILFEDAIKLIKENSFSLGVEEKEILDSCNFILAEDIFAKENHPSFDNSAVDGFAVKFCDLQNATRENPINLKIAFTIKAGDEENNILGNNSCGRIMTGAIIPNGTTAVVMKEKCEANTESVKFFSAVKEGENIRYTGDEIKKGEIVLKSGIEITPAVISLLATLGYEKINVFKKPKIAIITTGTELKEIREELQKGKIRNSNKYFLLSALKNMGVEINFQAHNVNDSKEEIYNALKNGIDNSDVTIITGGISVGDYDFIKDVLQDLNAEEIFCGVAIKPGKPTYFGKVKNKIVFGLPGNPVAVGVIFYEMVYPFLNILSGKNLSLKQSEAVITKSISKKTKRVELLRGHIEKINKEILVTPILKQGSHMLSGFANADCLIEFPLEKSALNEGEKVLIHFLPWNNI